MILIQDLLDAKDTCFEKIAQNAQEKNLTCVHFKSIPNTTYLQIFISNGVDYGRLVCQNFEQQVDFKITWEALKQICMLFEEQEAIDIEIKNNQILFFNKKMQYKTPASTLFIREHDYRFNFNEAKIVSMDDCNIMKEHFDLAKFVINKNNLISSDGCAVIENKLNADFGDNIYQFITPFPKGTWYFNPKQKVIVRHDKKISCSYKYGTGNYPLEALRSVLNQHFENHFECNYKEFATALRQCVKINDKIILLFEKDNINLMASNTKNQAVKIEVPAKYLAPPKRTKISFLNKYANLLLLAQNFNNMTIHFNDNNDNYLLMAKNTTKTVLIMGCK